MKKLSILPILCLVLLYTSNAFGWALTWYNDFQLYGPGGISPVGPGGLVQLIYDADQDGVDDPFDWWMSQPDPCQAMRDWLAAGCPPVGGDQLVVSSDALNPTHIIDYTAEQGYDPAVYDGYFGAEGGLFIVSTIPAYGSGIGLYTRFFTAEHPEECDWYGTVGTENPGELFAMYYLNNSEFPVFAVQGGVADQHIECPEPASVSMILGGIGLLLAFFRRKK